MLNLYWETVEAPWGRPQLCPLEQGQRILEFQHSEKDGRRSWVGPCTEFEPNGTRYQYRGLFAQNQDLTWHKKSSSEMLQREADSG